MGQQSGPEISEAQPQTATVTAAGRRVRFGLTNRLLVLLLIFIMVAEVAVYIPTIANFRNAWLRDRLAAASTAALVFEAAPAGSLPDELETAILRSVGAKTIVLKTKDARRLLAASDMPSRIDESFDMRAPSHWSSIVSAFHTLTASHDRVLNVVGEAPMGADHIEITLDEAPLRRDMWVHSINVLLLSLLSSSFVALLAALAIHLMVLRPVRRLTSSITAFGLNPEAVGRVITPSGRNDEIGVAEDALAIMQRDLLRELTRKKRLAALGLAVAKINHDLRNMLTSAQMASERLASVRDPRVAQALPRLERALDRAVRLASDVLAYGKTQETPPSPVPVVLSDALAAAAEESRLTDRPEGILFVCEVLPGVQVQADADQLHRILVNLMRNAREAIEAVTPARSGVVRAGWRREGETDVITLADNGPGLSERARDRIFQPFSGSGRPDGAGLGLAIARELVQGHGGDLALTATGPAGTVFEVQLPAAGPRPARRGRAEA
jgi:signal transduction histidine kinase